MLHIMIVTSIKGELQLNFRKSRGLSFRRLRDKINLPMSCPQAFSYSIKIFQYYQVKDTKKYTQFSPLSFSSKPVGQTFC